jgi:hypothetical protein
VEIVSFVILDEFPRCYVDPDRVGKTLSSDGSARVRANALSCLRRSGAPSFAAGPLDGSVCRCAQCYGDGHLKRFGKDTYSVANTYCRIQSASLVVRRGIDNMRAFWPEFCPHWHAKWFLADHQQDLRAALCVVWLQGGLHQPRLDAAAVDETFSADKWGRGRPGHFAATRRFVYSALHAPGNNKSPVHQATHGLNKTPLTGLCAARPCVTTQNSSTRSPRCSLRAA